MAYNPSIYSPYIVEPLRNALQGATPDERQHLRNEIMTMIGAM